MDDVVPRLSSVAAEIETPGQSPRSGLASPNAGILQSGDSFTKAFMHQARRLRTAVLHQKVDTMLSRVACPACACRAMGCVTCCAAPCQRDMRALASFVQEWEDDAVVLKYFGMCCR